MYGLNGKVAIITGAGRHKGLGQGIARRLAQEGCKIVISDIGAPAEHMPEGKIGNSAEMDQIVDELRAEGAEAVAIACDVTREAACEHLVNETVAAFGRVDILVNNAGIGYIMKHLTEVSQSEWEAVLGVNLMGAFLCTKHAAIKMIEQGDGGRIINIASQAGKTGYPHMAPYTASKHGVIGLTRSNAIDLAKHGITVNAVCPNHVTTGLGAEQNEYFSKFLGQTVDEYLAGMRGRIPLGRPGTVEDNAAMVAFLCSDEAHYITGESVNVSGGEEMH